MYYVIFVDDYNKFTWLYMMKKKNEVLSKFHKFLALVENITGKQLKKIRTDNGGEYTSEEFIEFYKQRGIIKEQTIPYGDVQKPL